MKGKLKIAVVLLMLGLLPVRALAAVTTGFCPFAHHHGAAPSAEPSHASHQHGSPAHEHGEASCSFCVEHCSSAAIVPSHALPKLAEAPSGELAVLYQRSIVGFIPDPLDPPPLAA